MSRPDLVSMLLDVSIDPCDGSVHPSLQYVLIRGFSAMGWEQPKAASEDMAMEILKMIRPSSSNLASGGKVASREYPALGDRVATLLEDARCPKVTPAMEEAGRECARSNDPSTFADIFEAMWKARPTARPDTAEARLREATIYRVEYDGFVGNKIGSYVTREGKHGVVLQQIGSKVVHVYGQNRITPGGDGYIDDVERSFDKTPMADSLKPSPPPADRREIVARVLARWRRSKNLHESLAAESIEKELLAALDGGR